MGTTLKERLKKLLAGRRAKAEARANELLAEEMFLKGHSAPTRFDAGKVIAGR
jgi:hypothetical protein